ncbi:MAG: hypothetical protein GX465_14615 [Acidobacteria bacterium]|nr:hypothetical protein [Acidobacteriota bacterium]
MPKPEDELTEEELPEVGLHEGDRPISTDAYLDEDGICFFPGPEAQMPTQVRIAAPVNFLAFIKALVVLDNTSEQGYKTIPYTYPEKPNREDVLGLVLNKGAIEMLQSKHNGKAFLLQAPNKTGQWLTLAEWNAEFNTDGLEVLARMRWEWWTKGGGVGTPGQRVTATGQVGHATQTDSSKFVKLGGKDGKRGW